MQSQYNTMINDANVTSAGLRTIYSIGLGSAQYWSGQSQNPPPPPAPVMNWENMWLADIAGASVGAAVDPANPVVGAIVGGVAASAVDGFVQWVSGGS